jgi:7-cyano-7-deazaguanine synthase
VTDAVGYNRLSVCVLFSGGIDSTACIHFYKEQGAEVSAVFIDYGQRAAKRELLSAQRISHYYNVAFERFSWMGKRIDKTGLILGRNLFFLTAVLMEVSFRPRIISMGLHAGTEYVDCSVPFTEKMQAILDDYTNGTIQLGVPFIKWHKIDIWNYCRTHSLPLELTYSCELGLDQPCGKCPSCRDLEAIYAGA